MSKLLVVDGSNLLFQMFYGMPSRIVNKDGKAIHGTLGFVGALLKTIRTLSPDHVVVLFDGECHNERKDADEAYKANRPDYSQMSEEETPFSQLPDIYAALDFLKIRHAETTVCETDDVIAAYVFAYKHTLPIVVSSFDSDFFQLISETVHVFRYRGDKSTICDQAYLWEKFKITPDLYADFKSLTGDTADNVKGIRGIGPKTATKLLTAYGSIDGILRHAQEIQSVTVRKAIEENETRLRLNQKLVTLNGNAELPFPLEELIYTDLGYKTGDVLSAIHLK